MSNFDVSILLRLVDRLTSPARQAAQSMRTLTQSVRSAAQGVGTASRNMERPFVNAMQRMGRKAQEFSIRVRKAFADIAGGPGARLNEMSGKLNAARWQMMTTMFFAAPLALPFKATAANELSLARLGNIAGWRRQRVGNVKDEFTLMMAKRNDEIRKIAQETQVSTAMLIEAYTDMVSKGVAEPDAIKSIKNLGMVIRATGMSVEDASALAFSLRTQFGITSESAMMDTYGKLIKAGNIGGFELKDMAEWMPRLGAMLKMFGMKTGDFAGQAYAADLAAWLQTSVKGAANATEAGNNMANLFQKMSTPETAKNFKKKMGIDLPKELNKTMQAGGSPIEKFVELAQRYLDKTKNPFLTGNLVADRQALQELASQLSESREKRLETRKAVHASGGQEVIDQFNNIAKTFDGSVKNFSNALSDLNDVLTKSVLGDAGEGLAMLTNGMRSFINWAKESKSTVRNIIIGFASFAGAVLAIRMLVFAFNTLKFGALGLWVALRTVFSVLNALRKVGGVGGFAGLARLGSVMRMLGTTLLFGGALARLSIVRTLLVGIGVALRGLIFGPWGLIAGVLLSIVPDGWWTKAGELLTQGFDIIKNIVLSSVESIKGWIMSIFDAFSGAASRVKQFASDTFGQMQLPSAPIMMNPSLQPGQTIPGIANMALPQVQQQNDNRTINNAVTVPITINATVNNATPQGIAGAVSGAGQSVGAAVRNSLSDGWGP